MAAVAEADTGDSSTIALDTGGLHAEMNADTGRGVPFLEKVRDFGGHRACHDAACGFADNHLKALGPGGGGDFQADENHPDADDVRSRRAPLQQALAFIEASPVSP